MGVKLNLLQAASVFTPFFDRKYFVGFFLQWGLWQRILYSNNTMSVIQRAVPGCMLAKTSRSLCNGSKVYDRKSESINKNLHFNKVCETK